MATDNEQSNKDIIHNSEQAIPENEQLQKEKEFKQSMSNGKAASDPSAQRNTGAGGYTQRSDQKDQLENLHIGGAEGVPQGGNDHDNAGDQASGPGCEVEGSYELDYHLRTREQKFGDAAPSGPATPAGDAAGSE